MKPSPIVAVRSFIEATRDTGYKSTGSAIAELVDNALEASAKQVNVTIEHAMNVGPAGNSVIRVTDDGSGMTPAVLRLALQFGGTTRFGSRAGTGRYGMVGGVHLDGFIEGLEQLLGCGRNSIEFNARSADATRRATLDSPANSERYHRSA
jgi:hypothetical protein